ncbi:10727_t:CDS:2, partial [Ambispora leptoticha]
PGLLNYFKTPTVLQYDEDWNVLQWGQIALVEKPVRSPSTQRAESHPVELFKLHLSSLRSWEKPWLPEGLDHVKAITDYLTEMQKIIKEKMKTRWPALEFPRQFKLILTVPAEWHENTRNVLQKAAYNAGLLDNINSRNLNFITESEAAAIHCMSILKEHNLKPGANFVVVDCGGSTVDITIRQLLDNKLSEIIERSSDLCGSTFIDREFTRFLKTKLGYNAIEKLKKSHYKQMQYLIQKFFFSRVKCPFDGERVSFHTIELGVPCYCPAVLDYVDEERRKQMEEADWLIEITFDDVKGMFDPVVERIIDLIERQLEGSKRECDALFLVGGFSESPYLVKKIRQLFSETISVIAVPPCPIAAVVCGAVSYGLNTIQNRRLRYTYGIKILDEFKPGFDPKKRLTKDGRIYRFKPLIKRDTLIDVDVKVTHKFVMDQTEYIMNLFAASNDQTRYCDEEGVFLVATLRIETPNAHFSRPMELVLTFGTTEVKASVKNSPTGETITTCFKYVE